MFCILCLRENKRELTNHFVLSILMYKKVIVLYKYIYKMKTNMEIYFDNCVYSYNMIITYEETNIPNIHSVRAVVSDHNSQNKELFFKSAILTELDKERVIVSEQIVGFAIDEYGKVEPLNDDMIELIAFAFIPHKFDNDYDGMLDFIHPESDKSLEVIKLAERVFFNVINMVKVEECIPDMPLDIQRHVLELMWTDGDKYNIPVSDIPHFIERRRCATSARQHKKCLAKWLNISKRELCLATYLRDFHW